MTEQYLEELIQKYAHGTATAEEVRQLMEWYHNANIGAVHWPAGDAGEEKQVYNRMLGRLHKEIKEENRKLIRLPWFKIAAAFMILIGAALLVFKWSDTRSSYITIANPSGKIQTVLLPDGSRVWLNTATTLKYNKSFLQNRDLQLNGEAYFQVTHDASHPFSIKAGEVTTTVLGTSFNIKAYEGENKTTVSVTGGSVKITDNKKELGVLKKGMQLDFDREQKTAATTSIDTTLVTEWRKGVLQFEGQSLGGITAALGRWYSVRFEFTDPALRNCRYYMSFKNTEPFQKIIAALKEITGMQYTLDKNSNKVMVSGKGCEQTNN
jgi:ferric-dicitrate binding protein FerR (iron transport regulator)